MNKVLKVPFKTKAWEMNKSTRMCGFVYFNLKFEADELEVINSKIELTYGTQYNHYVTERIVRESPHLLTVRKSVSNFLNLPFTVSKIDKISPEIDAAKISGVNEILNRDSTSLGNIELYIRGNWMNGSEKEKAKNDFRIDGGKYDGFTFTNLFSAFLKTSSKLSLGKMPGEAEIIDIEELENILMERGSYRALPVIQTYFKRKTGNFYIKKVKELVFDNSLLLSDTSMDVKRKRTEFKANMLDCYDFVDWIFDKLTSSSIVEMAHIVPVKHIVRDNLGLNQIADKDNGLLLPIFLHRFFDNGAITFNNKGKLKYKIKNDTSFIGLSKDEAKFFNLDHLSLKKEILTPARLKYLKYHQDHIFGKGI